MVTALLGGVLVGLQAACRPAPPRILVVRAGRLLDGTGGPAKENMQITVQDGLILTVGSDVFAPPPEGKDTQIIDARHLTVMPGLIDAHAHVLGAHFPTTRPGSQVGRALAGMRDAVRSGVTTIADLGGPLGGSLALRAWVGTGRDRGPRLLVSGPVLAVVSDPGVAVPTDVPPPASAAQGGQHGGQGAQTLDNASRLALHDNAAEVKGLLKRGVIIRIDSEQHARAAVRRLVDADVDLITVAFDPVNSHDPARFEAIVCAAVEEAKLQEIRLVAEATTPFGSQVALSCGVSAYGHGLSETAGPAMAAKLAEKSIPVVSTLRTFNVTATSITAGGHGRFCGHGALSTDPSQLVRSSRLALEEFLKAGVPIGLGSDVDTGAETVGDALGHELYNLQAAGVSPSTIVQIATSGAARVLELQDAVGTLAPGYRADLIAVEGKPDQDLRALEQVRYSVIDGVQQDLDGPGNLTRIWAGFRLWWSGMRD